MTSTTETKAGPGPWESGRGLDKGAEIRTEQCAIESVPIELMNKRPFSAKEQPILCSSSDGVTPPCLDKTLGRVGDSELFGAELSVTFSADGKQVYSSSDMGIIKIWNESNPDMADVLKGHYNGWVNTTALAASSDRKRLISGAEDGKVKIWNLVSREVLSLAGFGKAVNSVSFRPDAGGVVFGLADGGIYLWNWADPADAQRFKILRRHNKWVYSVRFAPDGKALASGSGDETIRLWDLSGKKDSASVRVIDNLGAKVYSVSFAPDSKFLAYGLSDGTANVWNIGSDGVKTFQTESDSVWSVAFSPDGRLVAMGLSSGDVIVWDWRNDRRKMLRGHDGIVWSVAFSPDGRRLVSGSADESIKIWRPDGQTN